jgi:multidrug efflux pump subunit AcrA (membrane-fusion protein)
MSRVAGPALTSKARARRRHRRNVTLATVITVALCAAGGGIAFATTRTPATDYRTTVAATGDVTQTVNLTGTVASASRKDVAFGTSGTVGSVAVKVGDSVTAGQTLATLQEASLTAAITAAQQTVTNDEQTLASDLTSESSGSTSSTSGSSGSSSVGGSGSASGGTSDSKSGSTGSSGSDSSSSSGAGSGSASSGGANSAAVTAATAAVIAAQKSLLAQYTVAQTALAATTTLVTASSPTCAPFLAATIDDASSTTGTTSTTDSSAASTAPATSSTATTPAEQLAAAKTALASCQTAISGVLDSETTTKAAQAQVQVLAGDLNTAVAALAKALAASTGATGASTSSAVTGTTGTTTIVEAAAVTGSTSGGTSGGSATITAETILADAAAITAAKAELAIANHNKEFATLTSPIAGTVAAVSITAGDSVSAGSSSEVITVIGDDGYVVSSTATLTQVEKLKTGEAVAVTVSGVTKALAGTVSSVGLLNVSTSSTTPSYDVTVAITDKTATLLNGASATMVVTADVAKSVLTVPTSALHRTAQVYRLDVLENGKEVAKTVKIGATGSALTQITSGVSAGAVVILADVSSTTIGDSTSTTTTTSSGLSGLTGSSTSGAGTGGPPSGFTPGGN